jgi:predicted phosphodiesterase|tara:strand:+ start:37872 stop:38933 length:1062 start_codon:yes stop_codon:yes gene_type:complete
MKIALLNDTHFGARSDSPAFIKYFNRFYDEIFFPYLEENNITTLIHLGDVVDRRKFINFNTAHNFQNKFWKRLWEMKIDTHIILGNHDTYYKNTNSINSMQQLITTFDGVNEPFIYEKPKTVEFDGLPILFVPWICPENEEESLKAITESQAQICMGHLEVKGFEMHKGHFQDHGLEMDLFKRFEKVYSGHYHRKSDNGTIFYLGTQYEITWSDYQCPKGFHVFDTNTRELTRIPNPISMFKKIVYNDKVNSYSTMDISEYENCFIKVIVEEKTDVNQFGDFIDRLHNEIHTNEVNVIEDSYNINSTADVNIVDQGEDTLSFLQNYINSLDTELDKNKMNSIVKDLYSEVQDK